MPTQRNLMVIEWPDMLAERHAEAPRSPRIAPSAEELLSAAKEELARSHAREQDLRERLGERETGDLSLQPPAWFWVLVAVLMVGAIFALGFVYTALRASR